MSWIEGVIKVSAKDCRRRQTHWKNLLSVQVLFDPQTQSLAELRLFVWWLGRKYWWERWEALVLPQGVRPVWQGQLCGSKLTYKRKERLAVG